MNIVFIDTFTGTQLYLQIITLHMISNPGAAHSFNNELKWPFSVRGKYIEKKLLQVKNSVENIPPVDDRSC